MTSYPQVAALADRRKERETSQPSVCAICLTADRPDMARQAVECFRRQTYKRKMLLVVNSGSGPNFSEAINIREPKFAGMSVGELRNIGASAADVDILIHWDDDDLSHPNRIAEQVALLQSSGADVVGYNRMLFWRCLLCDKPDCQDPNPHGSDGNGAWIYTGEILGTSLCYWRRTWERTPFAANHVLNEDGGFISEVRSKGGKVVAVDSIVEKAPRMIARIHAGNARNPAYNPEQMAAHPAHWKRVPEFDDYCRTMACA